MMNEAESLRAVLSYDEESGVFRWSVPGRGRKLNGEVGTVLAQGYLQIKFQKRKYRAHRLAWLFVHGEWPSLEIDHVNLDRSDNRIANLRLATDSNQKANSKTPKNNTSGFKGVCWDKRKSRWKAAIGTNGKNINLGLFDSPEVAHAAYCVAAKKYHGVFARTS